MRKREPSPGRNWPTRLPYWRRRAFILARRRRNTRLVRDALRIAPATNAGESLLRLGSSVTALPHKPRSSRPGPKRRTIALINILVRWSADARTGLRAAPANKKAFQAGTALGPCPAASTPGAMKFVFSSWPKRIKRGWTKAVQGRNFGGCFN